MIDTTPGVALAEDGSRPRAPYHDMITRSVAAAVYLSLPLCESILFTFFGRPGQAWGPSIGIDPVAVVRHAVAARRRRRVRDVLELAILTVTAAVVLTRIALRNGLPLTALTILAMALLITATRLISARTVFLVAAALVLLAGTISGFSGLVADLALALAGIALAWLSLVVSVFCTRRRAALIRDAAGRSAELGRPLAPAIEERLRESAKANIIVYAGSRADLPFLGSGQRIRDWDLGIDVTRGAGEGRNPVPFSTAELNEYVDLSFIGETTEQLTCLHRLYVDGRTVRPVADEPLMHLGDDLALAEVAAEDDSSRRVYFCLQQAAREGEVVVTLFVRPRLEGRMLRLEIALHALLPPAGWITHPVARLSRNPVDVLVRAMAIGSRLLTGPVGRLRSDIRRVRWQAARRRETRLAGRRGQAARRETRLAGRRGRPFDVGATITLREGISAEDLGALEDIVTIGASLQSRLLNTVRAFLAEHRVDTAEFDRVKQSIVTTTLTWDAEQVMGEMVGFGANNDFGSDSPGFTAGDDRTTAKP